MCRGDAVVEQLPSRSSPASAINPASVQLNPAVACCCKGCCVGSSVSLLPDAACCRNECCKLLDGVCNPCNSTTPTSYGHVHIFWQCQQIVARHCCVVNRSRLRLCQQATNFGYVKQVMGVAVSTNCSNNLWRFLYQQIVARHCGYVNRFRLWLCRQSNNLWLVATN